MLDQHQATEEMISMSQEVTDGTFDFHIDGLVQDCSISIANTLEILQSCTKPSIYHLSLSEISWYYGMDKQLQLGNHTL